MGERNANGLTDAVRQAAGGVAGETLKRAGSAAGEATGEVSEATGIEPVERVGEQVEGAAKGAGATVERAAGGGVPRSVREELRQIIRDTALEVLVPVARQATTQAAIYAVKRGPQMARDTLVPKLGAAIHEAGGPGAFAKGALSSVSSARTGMLEKAGVGGEPQARPWRERPLPVEEAIDVVAPLEAAYSRFGQFDEYAKVLSRGETVDERPNERIEWRRTDGMEASAVITFHRLSDRLTRVMVTYDQRPQGMLERTGARFRSSHRGLGTDLMRFKAFVEMSEEH